MKKLLLLWFVILLIVHMITTCSIPLTDQMVLNISDTSAPEIVILSPANDSYCANLVEISGIVTDLAENGNTPGRVTSLSYSVSGSAIGGDITPGEDGTFSFIFSVNSLGTNFTLFLSAVDWNGNSTTEFLTLRRNLDNGLPSFSGLPGNKSVIFSWDPVPETESYTLYYTENGSLPSEIMGTQVENVSSPYELSELDNGSLIIAMIKANPKADFTESLSDFVRAIPLSEFTLDVKAVPGFESIRIEWKDFEDIGTYEVFRSDSGDGIYYNISGPLSRDYYTDTAVENSRWYYYKVKPYLEGGTYSNYTAAQTDPFSPDFPLHIANISTPHWAEGIGSEGDYAYVASNNAGLLTVDISDPYSPHIVASIPIGSRADSVAVHGELAFAASSSTNYIIDISNPLSPQNMGTSPASGNSTVFYGNYALSVSSDLSIIDISGDPADFSVLKNLSVSGQDICIDGDYAYIAGNGLTIVSLEPNITDSYVLSTLAVASVNRIAVSGNYVFLSQTWGSTVYIVDVTNRAAPTTVGMGTITLSDSGRDVLALGNYLFAGDNQDGGVVVYDISDPSAPWEVGSHNTTGAVSQMTVNGDFMYVADYEGGLQVLNIANLSSPENRGYLDYAWACGVDIQGEYAFLSTWKNQIAVAAIDDPDNPAFETSVSTSSETFNIDVRGKYAFAAGEWSSGFLTIFDITDPSVPILLSSLDDDNIYGDISDLYVSGDYAYLSAYGYGLYIVDISDPVNPVLSGSCEAINGLGITVRGDFAYLADSNIGFRIINVSNPSSPFIVNTCSPNDEIYSIDIQGDYAFLADYDGGISSVDISDPYGSLIILDTVDPALPSIRAADIVIRGSRAYVADGRNGMQIINISDPSAMFLEGGVDINYGGAQLAVSGYYAYVADTDGIQIVELFR